MNIDIPLEYQFPHIYKFDEIQKKLIYELNALDLVLIENASEIFREFMLEGRGNKNLEKLLQLISIENKNSVFLPSVTFDVYKNKKGTWCFSKTKENRNLLKGYILECNKITNQTTDNSIIFTIIALNFGFGGHYGALLCDISMKKIFVFDSMSGYYKGNYIISNLEHVFIKLSKQIFIGDKNKNGVRFISRSRQKYDIVSVKTNYILQVTGSFEHLNSMVLSRNNKSGNKFSTKNINIQHTDSQNHFCYIWTIWFIQIYLRGKLNLFTAIITHLKNKAIIPIVVVKQYILGFINLLGNIHYPKFFFKRFPLIWSNHNNIHDDNFCLYSFNYYHAKDIAQALDNSLTGIKLKIKKKKHYYPSINK